ncbi:MAG TPA: tetratricopeptide repeat protein [Candidatus Kapabacteria bacterium]|nr:tetratricopeptide repeat protein [Candidatus Kapabacteria bacterium]
MKLRIIIAGFFIVAFAASASAQAQMGDRYQIALTYEQNGNLQDAAQIYYELFKTDPGNEMFYNDVERTFLAIKRYGTLDSIVTERIRTRGGSSELYSTLGAVKFHEGDDKDANAAWDSALALAGTNVMTYTNIAARMTEAQAYQAAVHCYLSARTALKDENAFADNLAYLYSLMLDYKNATLEYIRLVQMRRMPLQYVEGRMGMFTAYPEGRTAALEAVKQAVGKDGENLDLLHLEAWLYMENKSYGDAFNVYKDIDEMRNSGGRELMDFAMRALHDGQYTISLQAFHEVQKNSTDDHVRSWAAFGAANADEAIWKAANPDSLALAGIIAGEYDAVAKDYPSTQWADSATLRSADIRFDPLFDVQGAEQRVRWLIAKRSLIIRSGKPDILLGKIYTAGNKLDSAALAYENVEKLPYASPDVRQEARYLTGKLLYYNGNFDSAKTVLDECTQKLNAAYANDAIELLEIIQENAQGTARDVLKQFAQAELCKIQKNISRSIELLENIVQTSAGLPVADRALIALGEDYTTIRQFTQAVGAYQKLLDQFPESILRDRAQMRIGIIYDAYLHNTPEAIHAYEVLLEQYPNSIYTDEARKRVRALRGES